MKYLIIHIDQLPEYTDLTRVGISDNKFEELAVKYGRVIHGSEEFESQFNCEMISDVNDQLRIVKEDNEDD